MSKLYIHLLGLFSIGFPGFFRLFSIFFVGFFFSESIANEYSKVFLYVCYINALIGVPLASLYLERSSYLSLKTVIVYVLCTSFLFSCVASLFAPDLESSYILVISASVFSAALYEILRQVYINELEYKSIFISSVCTIFIFIFILIIPFKDYSFIAVISFASLMIPLLVFYMFEHFSLDQNSTVLPVMKVLNYTCISALSTSINFLLPLLVLNYAVGEKAVDIAQATSVIAILMLFPRLLSNKYIKLLRKDSIHIFSVNSYILKIVVVIILSASIFSLVMYFLRVPSLTIYVLMFFAIYLSQLSLPYSCVFAVEGKSGIMLKINFVPSLILTVCMLLFYFSGYLTVNFMLSLFIIYQLCKFYIMLYYFRLEFYK